jgi:hypothetical protein
MDIETPKVQSQSTDLILPTNILFIILKLSGIVDWSWWHVMSPVLFFLILWIIAFIVNTKTSWFIGFQLPKAGFVYAKKMTEEQIARYVQQVKDKIKEGKDEEV